MAQITFFISLIILDDDKQSILKSSTETLKDEEEESLTPVDASTDKENTYCKEVLDSAEMTEKEISSVAVYVCSEEETNESNESSENIDTKVDIESSSEINDHEILKDVLDKIVSKKPEAVVDRSIDDYKRLSHISEEIDFDASQKVEEGNSSVADLIDMALSEAKDAHENARASNDTMATSLVEKNIEEPKEDKQVDSVDEDALDHDDVTVQKKKKGFKGFGKKFKKIMRRNSAPAPKVDSIKKVEISSPIPIHTADTDGDNAKNFIPIKSMEVEKKHHVEHELSSNKGKIKSCLTFGIVSNNLVCSFQTVPKKLMRLRKKNS